MPRTRASPMWYDRALGKATTSVAWRCSMALTVARQCRRESASRCDVPHSLKAGSKRLFVTSAVGNGADGVLTPPPCRANTPCCASNPS